MFKAIIIDDDWITVNGLNKSVDWGSLDIEVVGTAQDGKEGLTQVERHRPDIILTDIYMPVMNGIEMLEILRNQGNDAEVVILSGYEDFKHAKSALKLQVNDYLSKPATIDEIVTVLKDTVEKVKRKNKTNLEEIELKQLLQHNISLTKRQCFKYFVEPSSGNLLHVNKMLNDLHIDLSDQIFSVIVIEFFKNRELNHCKPSEWSLFEYAVNNIVDELSHLKKGVYIADLQRNLVSVIVSTPKRLKKKYLEHHAKSVATDFIENILKFLKLQVWATVGSVVESTEDIYLSYKEAMNLLAERENLVDDVRIITKDDLQDKPRTSPMRPIEHYHSIIDAVVSGQSDVMNSNITELIDVLDSMEHLSIVALRDFGIDFMGLLVVALYDHGLRIEEVHPNGNVYKELESIFNAKDFGGWLQGIGTPICSLMETRVSSKHRKTIDFITRFVQDHYAEDITLDMIADKVFLTRNYLSQIFKQSTGDNYNNYVTRVRMEKAKELIIRGNYKLYEVSQMVGYKNTAYFSQLFKKYTGYNPSDFNQ